MTNHTAKCHFPPLNYAQQVTHTLTAVSDTITDTKEPSIEIFFVWLRSPSTKGNSACNYIRYYNNKWNIYFRLFSKKISIFWYIDTFFPFLNIHEFVINDREWMMKQLHPSHEVLFIHVGKCINLSLLFTDYQWIYCSLILTQYKTA